jgi:DNA-binding response OmpR family regulator
MVMVANGHEWSSRSLETLLQPAGYEVTRVFTAVQAREAIAERTPDALLLDHQLPDTTGAQLCRSLRRDQLIDGHTPVFVTTAAPVSRGDRIAALEAGAWDVLSLPVDGELLLLKLANVLAGWADRSDPLVDPDTGCYTQRGLFIRGGELAEVATRQGRSLSCVRFEAPGRATRLGRRAREAGRRSDLFAILSDERVAVIAPVDDEAGARAYAERLTAALRSTLAETGDESPISVGLATLPTPLAGNGIFTLLEEADRALVKARVQPVQAAQA